MTDIQHWTMIAPDLREESGLTAPHNMPPGHFAVGQGISISMNGAIAEVWAWPANVVTNYQATFTHGSLSPPPLSTAMNPTIYFTEEGAYQFTSSCQYPDGSTGHFLWSFAISAPSGKITNAFPGAPNFYDSPPRVALGQADPTAPGITISADATNSTPVDGFFTFFQLVNPQRYVSAAMNLPAAPCPANGVWTLDTPYCAKGIPFYSGPPTPTAAGGTATIEFFDNPHINCVLTSGQPAYSVSVQNESFQTVLAFMPKPTPLCPTSIWIPLAQRNWSWSCSAHFNNNRWVTFGAPSVSCVGVPKSFPQWSGNICAAINLNWGAW